MQANWRNNMNYNRPFQKLAIGIFGLGVSGVSSFHYLENKVQKVICWDDLEINRQKIDQQFLAPIADKEWQTLDMIIMSPGIPESHEIFSLAARHNILISSDIELFLKANPDSDIIAVTGTNGKSTTTALIGHILKENKLDYYIGGNIGLPVLSLPQGAKGYVLELSSFQLNLLKTIDPKIAILLNITPDHLDRHKTYEAYQKAKEVALMGNGLKIIGTSTEDSRKIYKKLLNSGEKHLIPLDNNRGIICDAQNITDNFFDFKTYKLPELPNLSGKHNQENIAAAFAACRALDLSAQKIIEQIKSFKGLDHRMQFIGSYKHISFYNDSKATNVNSAISSLSSFDNIFWLAGGIFKEENLLALEKYLKNIKKAYLFGQSKLLFEEYLKGKTDYILCENMQEAFNNAVNDAKFESKAATILLAPACASFDQFKNFEDRGNQFTTLYHERFTQK
jgi:UDP-N-acetylmuramoylalanine--D-glutamate ligase